ncbi:uncharacterized protein yc1106_07982 [Curvularia clavata]|uniref:Xylanolytic transcriptional activator regulatory domain-containing protein n=1 Tax=Curvularia clavata TaxID=95742 RepID=A0A9Q9DU88_CURCL|nr:uncharacterized protein yc1106_07982 [Curvularia clavata]
MAKSIIALLLAGAAAADYNVTYLDVLWNPAPTLTLVESNSIATTYELQCPTTTTPKPTPTTHADWVYLDSPEESASYFSSLYSRLRTEFPAVTPQSIDGSCVPFTLFQGPETYGFRLTDAQPGLFTMNGDCSWKGEFTKVPITCDAEVKGSLWQKEFSSGNPQTFEQSELSIGTSVGFAVATVVERAGTTGLASVTSARGETPARETGAASTGSQGVAGHAPVPTGIMRSGRGRRRGVTRLTPPSSSEPPVIPEPAPYPLSTTPQIFPPINTPALNEAPPHFQEASLGSGSPLDPLLAQNGPLPAWSNEEHLIDLYYLNFHAAHPILLPRHLYWEQAYPNCLKAAVHYIGACFSSTASRADLRQRTTQEFSEVHQPTPEVVQAQILYSVALFAQDAAEEGQCMLDSAIQNALALGMHKREFASMYAGGSTIVEESMRRTWYELYVVDGCIAALQRKSTFETNTVNADVLLPCENFIYEGGLCFIPPTLAEFHGNVFADEEKVFSSFCYRIEAVRLLGRVLTIAGTHGVHRDRVQAVDNSLAAFIHHLPRNKSETQISNTFGELDELMFQTHTIIQWGILLLHYPRGDLISPNSLTHNVPGADCTKLLCPCNRQHVHSVKAVEASRSISMLAALQAPAQKHSPLFVYPLALATVVQLSIGAVHAKNTGACMEQHSDRVKLLLGICKTLGRHWSVAESVLRTMKKVASAVFQGQSLAYTNTMHLAPTPGDRTAPLTSIPIERGQFDDIDMHNLYDLMGIENVPMNT